ncbi:hypothetical protein BN946_scf184994.g11 [Trametes cinnabarina]|uniref:Uncharacterized protein n=1 Tax=Pycnoporus cinnabarinus TaxID=5643 RepID=A0A060SJZ9_PYCCI|nr:hypothetical protein BN946_scf184994.g11 [Trametes cinnabarina]
MNKVPHPKTATSSSRGTLGVTAKSLSSSPPLQPGTAAEERARRHEAWKVQEQASLSQVLQRADASTGRHTPSSTPVVKESQRSRSDNAGDSSSRPVASRPAPHHSDKPSKSEPVTIRCTTTPINAPYAMASMSTTKSSKAGSSSSGTTTAQPGKSSTSLSSSRPSVPLSSHARGCSAGHSGTSSSSSPARKDGSEWTAVKSTTTPIIPPAPAKPKLPPTSPLPTSTNRPHNPNSVVSTSLESKPNRAKPITSSSSTRVASTSSYKGGPSATPSASPPKEASGMSSSRSKQALAERMHKEKEAHQRLVDKMAQITDMVRNRKPFTVEDASRSLAEQAILRAAGQAEASTGASTASYIKVHPSENASSKALPSRSVDSAPPKPTPMLAVKSTPSLGPSSDTKSKSSTPPQAQAKATASATVKPKLAATPEVSAQAPKTTQAIAYPLSTATSSSEAKRALAPAAPSGAPTSSSAKVKGSASPTTQTDATSEPASTSKAIGTQTDPARPEPGHSRSTRDVGASTLSPLPSPRLPKAPESHAFKAAASVDQHGSTTPTAQPKLDSVGAPSGSASREARRLHASQRTRPQGTESVKPSTGESFAPVVFKARDTKASRAIETPKPVSAFLSRSLPPKAPSLPAPEPLQIVKNQPKEDARDDLSRRLDKNAGDLAPILQTSKQQEFGRKPTSPPASRTAATHGEGEMKQVQIIATSSEASTRSVSTSSFGHISRQAAQRQSPNSSSMPREGRLQPTPPAREVSRRAMNYSDVASHTTRSSSTDISSISRFLRAFPPVPSTPTFAAEATSSMEDVVRKQISTGGSHVPPSREYEGKSKSSPRATRRPSTAEAHALPSMFSISVISDSGSATSPIRRPSSSDATCSPSPVSMREVAKHRARISKADTVLSSAGSVGQVPPPLPDSSSDVLSYASLKPVNRTGSSQKDAPMGCSDDSVVKERAVSSNSTTPAIDLRVTRSSHASPAREGNTSLRSAKRSKVADTGKPSSNAQDASTSTSRPSPTSIPPSAAPSVSSRSSSAITAESLRKLEERIAKLEALSASRAAATAPTKSSMKARADISTLRTEPVATPAEGSSSAAAPLRTNRAEVHADGLPRYSTLSPVKDDFAGSSSSLPAQTRRPRSRSDATEQLRHVNSVPFLYRSSDRLQEFKGNIGKREPLFGNEKASRSLTWLPTKSTQSLPVLEDKERTEPSKAKKLWAKAKNGLGLGKKEEPKALPSLDFSWMPKPDPAKPRHPPNAWPTEKRRHVI